MITEKTVRLSWTFTAHGPLAEEPVRGDHARQPIFPRTIEIEWYPSARLDTPGGALTWSVRISGQQIKKDGSPSQVWSDHSFRKGGQPEPNIILAAIELTRARALTAIEGLPQEPEKDLG